MISHISPPTPRVAQNAMAAATRIKRGALSLSLRFLNFNENILRGEFISQHSIRSTGRNTKLEKRESAPFMNVAVYPIQNIAFAGIGIPMNDVVCRVSILNLARRIAPATGISNAVHGSHCRASVQPLMRLNTIIPGATPKVTRSDRESSSFPRLNMRAGHAPRIHQGNRRWHRWL